MTTIVHLSDIHFGRIDSRIVDPLVSAVEAVKPDLVAVSGDLTQRARDHQFREARTFLDRLPLPRLVVPGNHDVPLFNLAARFINPYAGYRRHIEQDLEPVYEGAAVIAVGLNSARTFPFDGGGRLNAAQVGRAAARLRSAPVDAVRIVVTHHPFDIPEGQSHRDLIGRSDMAMRELASAGADVFLAGHLHVSHVGQSASRYRIAGHSALVVQAGTMSTRQRGELNTMNVLHVEAQRIDIVRYSWSEVRRSFEPAWRGTFLRTADGWR